MSGRPRAERAANMARAESDGVNILLVEDHPDTATLLKAYLESCGHRVATAGTCQEALSHPELARIEVLICDIGLPDGSGWDLLPQLRARIGPVHARAGDHGAGACRRPSPKPGGGLSGPPDQTVCAAPAGRASPRRPEMTRWRYLRRLFVPEKGDY